MYSNINITKINFEEIYNFKKQQSTLFSVDQHIILYDDKYLTKNNIFNIEAISPIKVDAKIYFLCPTGNISISLNYLNKGSMLVLNGHHIIDDIRLNKYWGHILLFSLEFILYIINWITGLQVVKVINDFKKSLVEVEKENIKKVIFIVERLKSKLRYIESSFYRQIVKIEAINFTLKLATGFVKDREKHHVNNSGQYKVTQPFNNLLHYLLDISANNIKYYFMQQNFRCL